MQVKVLQVGPIGTNCYLLEDEKAHVAAVIDPGDEAGRILQVIKDDGVDVKYIRDFSAPPGAEGWTVLRNQR